MKHDYKKYKSLLLSLFLISGSVIGSFALRSFPSSFSAWSIVMLGYLFYISRIIGLFIFFTSAYRILFKSDKIEQKPITSTEITVSKKTPPIFLGALVLGTILLFMGFLSLDYVCPEPGLTVCRIRYTLVQFFLLIPCGIGFFVAGLWGTIKNHKKWKVAREELDG